MIVRFDKEALVQSQQNRDIGIEVEGTSQVSEADKIIGETKQKIADGSVPATGVSASNSGRGHDPISKSDGDFTPTLLDETVEEEPGPIEVIDSPEVTPGAEIPAEEVESKQKANISEKKI